MKFQLSKKKISIISVCLVLVLLFSLIINSLGYFSDTILASTDGTTGTVQVGFDDSGINLLNPYGQDILNPGDARPVVFTVTNDGNKSVDTEVVITLTSSVPMMNSLDNSGNGSLDVDDLLDDIVSEGEPDDFIYDAWGPYSSEYELYWAKDIVFVEGRGYYPKATEGNRVMPVMQRYINNTMTQIVYVLDGSVLSGNMSLDEQEKEYKKFIDLNDYEVLSGFDIYQDYDLSLWGIEEPANLGTVYIDNGEVENTKIFIIPDSAEGYNEFDETIIKKGFEYLNVSDIISAELKHIIVPREVHTFLNCWYDDDWNEYFEAMTVTELTEKYGITVEYYDNYKGFEDPAYPVSVITASEYSLLGEEEKANYVACADSQTYEMVLLFDPYSGNEFQNSSVSIKVEVRAKQHRNTEAGWELVGESLNASIDTSVFTVENNLFGQVELTGVQDGIDLASLTNVEIPEGVEVIPQGFFRDCENLETVKLSSTVKEIGKGAFMYCYNLREIELNDGLEFIGDSTFYCCESLKELNIPDSVTSVGENLLYNCTSLESVTIGSGLTVIPYHMFYGTENLKSIVIPETVKELEWCAFSFSSMERIVLPDGIETIPYECFYYCESLKEINIPENVKSIGDNAFYGCTSLESIYIPESVESIGSSAFRKCSNLNNIILDEDNKNFYMNTDNTVLYNKDKTSIICFEQNITTIDLSDSKITEINSYMGFNSNENIQKVILPDTLKKIGYSTFSGCSSLQEIVLPEGLEVIGYDAFNKCNNLKTIVIPDSVTTIDRNAFYCSSNVTTTVYTNNNVAKSYNWSGSKRIVTFLPYEAYVG